MAKKKRKYSKSSGKEVENEMHRYKRGKAKSGPGGNILGMSKNFSTPPLTVPRRKPNRCSHWATSFRLSKVAPTRVRP